MGLLLFLWCVWQVASGNKEDWKWIRLHFQGGNRRRLPPHSSGSPPAGPSLRLRHCCCEWTAEGCSSPGKTALSRCSHYADTPHGRVLELITHTLEDFDHYANSTMARLISEITSKRQGRTTSEGDMRNFNSI